MVVVAVLAQNDKNDDDFSSNSSSNSSATRSASIPRRAWIVTAILSSVATMTMYAETMLIPAIPGLINDFSISYSTSSWILAIYLVAAAVMTPITGKLSDIYGKKKVLLVIMIIYTFSVSIGGFANSISFLLATRALQGIGLSMFPIAFSMARDQFPRQKVAIGQGIISSMYASGSVIGLAVGSSIILYYGWHATYYSLIPIAAILTFVIWKFIRAEDEYNLTAEQGHHHQQLQHRQLRATSAENTTSFVAGSVGSGGDSNNVNGQRHYDNTRNKKTNAVIVETEKAHLDVKGAITLALAITTFLVAITFLEPGSVPAAYEGVLVAVLLTIGAASLVFL